MYFAVAEQYFKAQIIYRFEVVMTTVAVIGKVLFAFVLWGAVFKGKSEVGGFTYETMLTYYLFASLLSSLDIARGVSGEVSGRIRGGTFSKFMVIPANPLAYFISMNMGAACYYALFSLGAAGLSAVIFAVSPLSAASPQAVLCALIMVPLGLVFMVEYHYFIGVLAFKFQEIGFFLHVQGSVLQFLTGAIIPLSLLPASIPAVLRFLPFTYVTYAPAMLLSGQMGASEGFFGITALILWVGLMAAVCQLTYGRLRVKYDGVGI